ncbi:MAG: hypothetical protein KC619_31765 [Myxococcales bacterium]|nr:hypothetical protein [Myxococcales bacterium]
MGRALTTFHSSINAAESIWRAKADALAEYTVARKRVRTAQSPADRAIAKQEADAALALKNALVQAAHVRVVTAWEVFLYDLVEEYLTIDATNFRTHWKFRATKKTPYGLLVATIEGRPFQNLRRAKGVLKRYLGRCILGSATHTGVDFSHVEQALVLRHSIVHRGGAATHEMRQELGIRRQSATGYLEARPGPTPSVPATHFERIKAGVLSAAVRLDARAWMVPPRPQ